MTDFIISEDNKNQNLSTKEIKLPFLLFGPFNYCNNNIHKDIIHFNSDNPKANKLKVFPDSVKIKITINGKHSLIRQDSNVESHFKNGNIAVNLNKNPKGPLPVYFHNGSGHFDYISGNYTIGKRVYNGQFNRLHPNSLYFHGGESSKKFFLDHSASNKGGEYHFQKMDFFCAGGLKFGGGKKIAIYSYRGKVSGGDISQTSGELYIYINNIYYSHSQKIVGGKTFIYIEGRDGFLNLKESYSPALNIFSTDNNGMLVINGTNGSTYGIIHGLKRVFLYSLHSPVRIQQITHSNIDISNKRNIVSIDYIKAENKNIEISFSGKKVIGKIAKAKRVSISRSSGEVRVKHYIKNVKDFFKHNEKLYLSGNFINCQNLHFTGGQSILQGIINSKYIGFSANAIIKGPIKGKETGLHIHDKATLTSKSNIDVETLTIRKKAILDFTGNMLKVRNRLEVEGLLKLPKKALLTYIDVKRINVTGSVFIQDNTTKASHIPEFQKTILITSSNPKYSTSLKAETIDGNLYIFGAGKEPLNVTLNISHLKGKLFVANANLMGNVNADQIYMVNSTISQTTLTSPSQSKNNSIILKNVGVHSSVLNGKKYRDFLRITTPDQPQLFILEKQRKSIIKNLKLLTNQ